MLNNFLNLTISSSKSMFFFSIFNFQFVNMFTNDLIFYYLKFLNRHILFKILVQVLVVQLKNILIRI